MFVRIPPSHLQYSVDPVAHLSARPTTSFLATGRNSSSKRLMEELEPASTLGSEPGSFLAKLDSCLTELNLVDGLSLDFPLDVVTGLGVVTTRLEASGRRSSRNMLPLTQSSWFYWQDT